MKITALQPKKMQGILFCHWKPFKSKNSHKCRLASIGACDLLSFLPIQIVSAKVEVEFKVVFKKKSSIVWKNSGRWAIVSAISSSVPPSISTLTTTKSSTDADAIKQRKKLSRWAKLPERASGHGFTTTGTLNKRPLWRTLSGTERHHNLVSEMRFPRYKCRQTQYSDFCTCYGTRVLRGLVQNHGCNCRPPSWNLELMLDWCKPRSKNLVRCLGRLPDQEISVIMGVRSHKILKTSAFFRLKSSAVS